MKRAAIVVIAKLVLAASVGVAGLWGSAQAATVTEEDQPGWSCVDDGNRVCGPGNPQGVPAGQYDAGGVLIVPWAELGR